MRRTDGIQALVYITLDIQPFKYRLTDQVGLCCGRSQIGRRGYSVHRSGNILCGAISPTDQESRQFRESCLDIPETLFTDIIEHCAVAGECGSHRVIAPHGTGAYETDRFDFRNRHSSTYRIRRGRRSGIIRLVLPLATSAGIQERTGSPASALTI